MRHAKNATLVLCLFVLYCVLLSQGLKASAASAFFGALAAVPLTVHLYHRVWPPGRVSENVAAPAHPARARSRTRSAPGSVDGRGRDTNRAGLTGQRSGVGRDRSLGRDHAGIRRSSKAAVARLGSAHNSRVDGHRSKPGSMRNCPKCQNLGWICSARLPKGPGPFGAAEFKRLCHGIANGGVLPRHLSDCSEGFRTRSCSMSASRRFEWKANCAAPMFSSDTRLSTFAPWMANACWKALQLGIM